MKKEHKRQAAVTLLADKTLDLLKVPLVAFEESVKKTRHAVDEYTSGSCDLLSVRVKNMLQGRSQE